MRKICLVVILGLFVLGGCSKKSETEVSKASVQEPTKEAAQVEGETGESVAEVKEAAEAEQVKKTEQGENGVAEDKAKDAAVYAVMKGEKYEALGWMIEMGVKPEKDVVVNREIVQEDGTFEIEEMYAAMVVMTRIRRHHSFNTAEDLKAEREKSLEAYEMVVTKDEPMSLQLGKTTFKATYLTGHNEDTRQNIEYLVSDETFDFGFRMSVGADFIDNYQAEMDIWVKNLKLVEKK